MHARVPVPVPASVPALQLASFVVGSQIWNNIVAVVLPCLCRKSTARRMEKKLERAQLDLSDPAGRALLRQAKSHAWQESRLGEYDTFQDYTEMRTSKPWRGWELAVCLLSVRCGVARSDSIRLRHVLLHGVFAGPSGGVVEQLHRDSGRRLQAVLQHTAPSCSQGWRYWYVSIHANRVAHVLPCASVLTSAVRAGVWFRILQAMSIMSVITNCVHIAFTSTQLQYYLPFVANHNKLVLTFVFEHIVLGLRFVITWMVPHVPEAVEQRVRADNARLSAASLRSEFSLPVGRNGMVAAV